MWELVEGGADGDDASGPRRSGAVREAGIVRRRLHHAAPRRRAPRRRVVSRRSGDHGRARSGDDRYREPAEPGAPGQDPGRRAGRCTRPTRSRTHRPRPVGIRSSCSATASPVTPSSRCRSRPISRRGDSSSPRPITWSARSTGCSGPRAQGVPKSTDLAVLQATLDLVLETSTGPGVLHGLVDPNRVVAAGPLRRRGRGVPVRIRRPASEGVDLVFRRIRRTGRARARRADEARHGDARHDRRHHPAGVERAGLRRRCTTPKYLVEIPGAGHLVFSDICLIGRSQGGVIGIVKAIKLADPGGIAEARLRRLHERSPSRRQGVPGDRPVERRVLPLGVAHRRAAGGTRHGRGRRPRRVGDRRASGLIATRPAASSAFGDETGGGDGDRTHYLLHAMQALYQLSYAPVGRPRYQPGAAPVRR